MKPERIFDLVVWFLIVVGGLITAYVCFGILSSEASGKLKEYSVGGAIAGALVSWGVLTSVYLQLRSSTGELEKLRERAEELQHKLIRGAPRPLGFDTEVDERQRIVLARPKEWQPKGGTIFDLELSQEKLEPSDTFAPTFRCYFGPIDNSTPSRDEFYKKELAELKRAEADELIHGRSSEMIQMGGEGTGAESLKIIVTQFARIEIKRNRETGRIERTWNVIHRDAFAGRIYSAYPEILHQRKPVTVKLFGWGFRTGGTCHVNGQSRETRINSETEATVTLIDSDVLYPLQLELTWENPDTSGLRSRRHGLVVVAEDEQSITSENRHAEEVLGSSGNADTGLLPGAPTQAAPAADGSPSEEKNIPTEDSQIVYHEVARMRVFCYNLALGNIYLFDFWDDARRFNQTSGTFNQVLSSVRFLT